MKSFSIDNKSTITIAKMFIPLNASLKEIFSFAGFNNLKAFHISHIPEISIPAKIILFFISPNSGKSVLATKVEAIQTNVILESCCMLNICVKVGNPACS